MQHFTLDQISRFIMVDAHSVPQSCVAQANLAGELLEALRNATDGRNDRVTERYLAEGAIAYADALLAVLSRESKT